MKEKISFFRQLLNQPLRVFWICLCFGIFSLLFNGNLLHLYKLHRDKETLIQQIAQTKLQVIDLEKQLSMASPLANLKAERHRRHERTEN